MKIYQPLFSNGDSDILGSFLVVANTKEEAEKNAMIWFTSLEDNLQSFFAPLSEGTVAIVEMKELKTNNNGILVPPLF